MELYPAIDLRGGKAVRLLRGDYAQMTVYSDAPLETARAFKAAGARYLHLVDLDAAKDGGTPNFEAVAQIIRESGLMVEVGGGIRDMDAARKYLDAGALRVIIGTAAVTNPDFLREALVAFGEKIAVGVDLRDGFVATHGWTQTSAERCEPFCARMQEMGVKTLICTDISRDGAMQGVNAALYEELSFRFSMSIIASGGVTRLSDLTRLADTGVHGAILGKSLYTGGIDLAEAVALMGKGGCPC